MKKILFYFILWIINNFLSGTHFFKVKEILMNYIGIKVGKGSCIVGPLYCGTSIKIKIGENCWIGRNISFEGDGEVTIENNVDIGPNCVISTGGHSIGEMKRRAGKGEHYKIIIKDGCWLGTNVTIVNNTCIDKGVVLAAGCVVNKDIEKNVLAAGCPVVIKKHLGEEQKNG